MPELPEVETVRLGITSFFEKQKIKDIVIKNRRLRFPVPDGLEESAKNQEIIKIKRRGKYLILNLSNEKSLIVHLGMAGKVRIVDKYEDNFLKHDHIIISFYDCNKLFVYNDSRRFGCFTICYTNELKTHKLLKDIGVEPLSDDLNKEYLFKSFKNRSMNIKTALLNQKIIAGIGNIYACEALFDAKISPKRKACNISKKELEALIISIKKILKKAIKAGGTTIRDYADPSGNLGYFANELAVYGREGQKCLNSNCKSSKNNVIKKITQNKRSTFYCANCQH